MYVCVCMEYIHNYACTIRIAKPFPITGMPVHLALCKQCFDAILTLAQNHFIPLLSLITSVLKYKVDLNIKFNALLRICPKC